MHAKVNIANGTGATDIKLGTVEIDGMTVQCMEMDPNSSYLLSVSQLTSLGYTAIFADDKVLIIPPALTLHEELKQLMINLSKNWKKHIITIQKVENIYKIDVDASDKLQPHHSNVHCEANKT